LKRRCVRKLHGEKKKNHLVASVLSRYNQKVSRIRIGIRRRTSQNTRLPAACVHDAASRRSTFCISWQLGTIFSRTRTDFCRRGSNLTILLTFGRFEIIPAPTNLLALLLYPHVLQYSYDETYLLDAIYCMCFF
jgi:hypothetical protein